MASDQLDRLEDLGATPVQRHETVALYYAIVLVIVGSQLLSVGLIAELMVSITAGGREGFSDRETTAASPAARGVGERDSERRYPA